MKKNFVKRFLALGMASTMLFLAACGTNSTTPEKVTDAGGDVKASADTKTDDKIHPMRYLTPGNMPTDYENVLKEVNKKLQADGVNIDVSFIRIPWDAYEQKLNAMLAAGDPFEMIHVMQDVKNITSLAIKESIVPIDQYMDKYPDLKAKFTDLEWSAANFKNETYAVPARWRDFSKAYAYLFTREDSMNAVTEKYPETTDELFDASKKMQANIEAEVGKKPYMWVHQLKNSPAFLHPTYDTWPFYVDMALGLTLVRQDGTVDSYFESEEFKKDAQYFRKVYTEGLINPDILNLDHMTKYDAVKIGAILPSPTFGYGDEIALKENIPTAKLKAFWLAPEKKKLIYTLGQNLNAISSTAEDPESGLKFLNWIYADKTNHDLFFYGIEGTHYTASSPDRIEFIKGDDNNPLYSFDTWMSGYLPYMRFDEKFTDEGIEFDRTPLPESEVVVSPMAAFLFDASNVQTELTNLETEMMSSMLPIRYGLVDYETGFASAIEKLKKAGLDKYIEEYRTQFAEFQKANAK